VEDDWQWVSVRTYLAQAHVRRKIPLKAEEILKSALVRASKQEGDPGRGSARIFNVFAEICLNAGQIQEAQVYLNRALAICEDKILHVTVLGRTYYLLARTNMQLKQFDPAEIWMGKYLDLALKEGFVQDVATAKFGMAQIQYSKGRPYEASRLAEEARYLFERIGMHQETVDCDSFLVETKQSLQ
jgi:tetratricopeptide (TPR) repeat protein